jgi:hypothetical protein
LSHEERFECTNQKPLIFPGIRLPVLGWQNLNFVGGTTTQAVAGPWHALDPVREPDDKLVLQIQTMVVS